MQYTRDYTRDCTRDYASALAQQPILQRISLFLWCLLCHTWGVPTVHYIFVMDSKKSTCIEGPFVSCIRQLGAHLCQNCLGGYECMGFGLIRRRTRSTGGCDLGGYRCFWRGGTSREDSNSTRRNLAVSGAPVACSGCILSAGVVLLSFFGVRTTSAFSF